MSKPLLPPFRHLPAPEPEEGEEERTGDGNGVSIGLENFKKQAAPYSANPCDKKAGSRAAFFQAIFCHLKDEEGEGNKGEKGKNEGRVCRGKASSACNKGKGNKKQEGSTTSKGAPIYPCN